MRVRAHVHKGAIVFGNIVTRALFYEKFDGKDITIEDNDHISDKKRRFFEGCLVPVTFYTHPHSGWETFADAREALKLEFLGREVKDLHGEKTRVTRSTADLSNAKFGEFIEAIVAWLTENQLVDMFSVDPENYVKWRDSAPASEQVYPPLARLKERYDREKGTYGSDAQVSVPGSRLEGGSQEDRRA